MKSFVIQKYIERPLLIRNRKFDIRVWLLVNQDFDLFFFSEGYLRLSAIEYQIDDLANDYVHLTNNAIQKNCPQYGEHEEGNQLSFADLRSYLQQVGVDFDQHVLARMKHQA